MYFDEAEISVQSGDGGDGMVHFRREKYVPRGGPDGGDGGRGASVILEVDPSMRTLMTFRRTKKFEADKGDSGGRANRSGHGAEDLVLRVPAGPLVTDATTKILLADLVE